MVAGPMLVMQLHSLIFNGTKGGLNMVQAGAAMLLSLVLTL